MNCINFRQLEKNIVKRTQEILNLHQELPKYLTLEEKLRVVVDPDYQRQAVDLIAQQLTTRLGSARRQLKMFCLRKKNILLKS